VTRLLEAEIAYSEIKQLAMQWVCKTTSLSTYSLVADTQATMEWTLETVFSLGSVQSLQAWHNLVVRGDKKGT
jgi:hypothetical protein